MVMVNDDAGPDSQFAPSGLHAEWDRLLAVMPAPARQAITPELWNPDWLHALDLPVRDIPISELEWLFDIPLWSVDGVPFQASPNEVRAQPNTFREQFVRTMASDLAWPIHIMCFRGRLIILDGVHRLLKADMLGEAAVQAMELCQADYASIVYPPER